jgi:hypothetical protein
MIDAGLLFTNINKDIQHKSGCEAEEFYCNMPGAW